MIHTCLSTLISQREVSHVILAQGDFFLENAALVESGLMGYWLVFRRRPCRAQIPVRSSPLPLFP